MMRRLCLCSFTLGLYLCAVVMFSGAATSAMASSIALDTTSRTYVLFLDMQEMESLHNVELVVNQAEKSPANPVLPTGDLNDFDFHRASTWGGNVIFDENEKIFKVWYNGGRGGNDDAAIGYAWSEDGVVWHKPKLGLYEYRGSKNNNICWRSPTGTLDGDKVHPNLTDHFVAIKDYREPDPEKRYKGWNIIYFESAKTNRHFPIYSADGIHWRLGPNPVASYPRGDIGNAFIDYDDPDPARRIKIYGHIDAGYGPDVEHCIPDPNNPVIAGPNIPSPNKDGLEDTIHLSAVLHYKGYYIMLYDYNFWLPYYGYVGKVDIRQRDARVPKPKTGIFTGDTRLAVNRDGVSRFVRVNPDQPVITRGTRGEWDGGFTVTVGPIVHNDKIYMFYNGVEENAGISEPQWTEIDAPYAIRSGLATLRLDGFTNLQTKDGLSQGTATTIPIEVKRPEQARLVLNASHLMPYRDWIEVELLDAGTNLPIEGYRREDGTRLFQDGIRIPVEWSQHKTLDGVKSGAIKIRFNLWGQAKLYSFHFE